MSGDILVLNSGSSSIKFALFASGSELECLARGAVDGIGGPGRLRAQDGAGTTLADRTLGGVTPLDHAKALSLVLEWSKTLEESRELGAVGHRVVHGGTLYSAPVEVDAAVLTHLQMLVPLAPLHQSQNIAGVRAAAALRPNVPQIACFDTAFHATQASLVQQFALPRALSESGVRRYGFHGLSYEYIASRLRDIAGAKSGGKVVAAHLGNGASLCALRDGRSVDSSMGFTALDGLPMGTRCGALDPGVVLYLLNERGMSPDAVTDLLYRRSGLLGVSGISNDMRVLLADEGAEAAEAVEMFVYRIARELGAMAAALGGLDALVFTAGIGEHAAPVRAAVCARAAWLGVHLDAEANIAGSTCISAPDSRVAVYVIATDESLMVARHVRDLLQGAGEARRLGEGANA